MGNVEDVRKVIQDLVAPDLKALAVRLEALEKEMKLRFDHAEKQINGRFEQINGRFEQVNGRFDHAEKVELERFASLEKLAAARHEAAMATMASILNALEMEKRLARLESERMKIEAQHA